MVYHVILILQYIEKKEKRNGRDCFTKQNIVSYIIDYISKQGIMYSGKHKVASWHDLNHWLSIYIYIYVCVCSIYRYTAIPTYKDNVTVFGSASYYDMMFYSEQLKFFQMAKLNQEQMCILASLTNTSCYMAKKKVTFDAFSSLCGLQENNGINSIEAAHITGNMQWPL